MRSTVSPNDLNRAISIIQRLYSEGHLSESEVSAIMTRVSRSPQSVRRYIKQLENERHELDTRLRNSSLGDYEPAIYWSHVKDLAREVLEQGEDGDSVSVTEQSHWIIYNSAQLAVLMHTNNLDAWEDAGIELGANPIGIIALFAMAADVEDAKARIALDDAEEEE